MPASSNSRKRIDVESRLRAEGWVIVRYGPGDHVQWKHPDKQGRVTIDSGPREIPVGTLRSIYRQAGWKW